MKKPYGTGEYGHMKVLRRQEQLYLVRRNTLNMRLKSVRELILDNGKRLEKVQKQIRLYKEVPKDDTVTNQ